MAFRNIIRFLAIAVVLGNSLRAFAFETNQTGVFAMIEENDLAVDTDRHYTQGIKLSYLFRDGQVPKFLSRMMTRVPTLGFEERAEKFGLEIGQSIYTPANIQQTNADLTDRPYAGWLYTGFIYQRRGLVDDRFPTLQHFQLDLGIIGPDSLADRAQTWVHEVRGFQTPKGWNNQLKDEPGIALKYQRLWLLSPWAEDPRYFDFIPSFGLSLGNVETSLRAGGTIRVGVHLPDDFGPQTISSLMTSDGGWSRSHGGSRWGFYAFTGLEGWVVAYSVFLDGNIYHHHNNAHVDHEPFVAEWKSGFVLVLDRLEFGSTFVWRTREFVGQQLDNGYGSLFWKVKF